MNDANQKQSFLHPRSIPLLLAGASFYTIGLLLLLEVFFSHNGTALGIAFPAFGTILFLLGVVICWRSRAAQSDVKLVLVVVGFILAVVLNVLIN